MEKEIIEEIFGTIAAALKDAKKDKETESH